MFSNLGLLKGGACPDGTGCHRVRCFFHHDDDKPRPRLKSLTKGSSSAAVDVSPNARKRPTENPVAQAEDTMAKKRALDSLSSGDQKGVTKPSSPVVKVVTASSKSTIPPRATSPLKSQVPSRPNPPQPVAGPSTLVPIVSKNAKVSPHPRADRQKGLRTLHTQFEKLYASIPAVTPEPAKQSAIQQESDIATTSSNLAAYKRAIHHAAVQVSRRVKPDSLSHPSVGTMKESIKATEKAEKELASKLTLDRIEQYLLPVTEFEKWRYPNPDDPELVNPPELQPDGEGTGQTCSRCKKNFVVSSKNLEARIGECHFHHGRLAPERIEGRRTWIYSCCKRARGEAGCEEGVHVYTAGDDDQILAKRVSYVKVGEEEGGTRTGSTVLGMDCEMIHTTAGLSLARVTIVDENGVTVLDEIVRQHVPVLDVNARFSGISLEQLDEAIMEIKAVRSAALMFIGPDTVLVGHGLENDLRALRILHNRIIDTAVVFPHDKGHPFRRALRDIVKEKLGIFIQERTADLGHSSAEDAKAALDLLKWKVRDDKADRGPSYERSAGA